MAERPADPELEESTNRWMVWGFAAMVLMVLIFPIYRFYEPSSREADREAQLEFLAEQGSDIYAVNCASCHGVEGQGGIGPALNSQQFLESSSDEQTIALIAVGVPGSLMSAYSLDFGGSFTSEQIEAIATFIRSWEDTAPDVPNWREPLAGAPTVSPDTTAPDTTAPAASQDTTAPATTAPSTAQDTAAPTTTATLSAEALYVANCAACHGADLEGVIGPALAGEGAHLGDHDADELAQVVANGEGGMPAFAGTLTPEEIEAIVEFILAANAG